MKFSKVYLLLVKFLRGIAWKQMLLEVTALIFHSFLSSDESLFFTRPLLLLLTRRIQVSKRQKLFCNLTFGLKAGLIARPYNFSSCSQKAKNIAVFSVLTFFSVHQVLDLCF